MLTYLLNFEDDLDRLLEHQYESLQPDISIEHVGSYLLLL